MVLRGILDRTLAGSICIRGNASITDVAKASEPNKNYQRSIIKEHKKDIVNYLEKREYLFFPEVVLSYTINEDLDNVQLSKSYSSIIETGSAKNKDIKFSVSQKTFAGKESRTPQIIYTVTIDIDVELLQKHKPLKRIDGNHRLTAAEEMSSSYEDIQIPFCIILLKQDADDEKFESVIFHNINSKGRHLTSEENLKAILNKDHFDDAELERNFSWSYVKARQLVEAIDFTYLSSIKNAFVLPGTSNQLHKRTVAIALLEFLRERSLIRKTVSIDNVLQKLNIINAIYSEVPELALSHDEGLLIAFTYYAFKQGEESNRHLTAFKNWIIHNNIHELKHIDCDSIVKIYDKVLEQKLRIFMAMPYYDDKEVDRYNEILQKAINTIVAKNPHLNLTKYPIMREEGPSIDIITNLLNNIRNCEIFIADITKNNVNVFFEYGSAHGLNKPIIVVKKADDKSKVPLDVDKNLRMKYEGHYGLEELLVERINQTVKHLGFVLNE